MYQKSELQKEFGFSRLDTSERVCRDKVFFWAHKRLHDLGIETSACVSVLGCWAHNRLQNREIQPL